MKTFITLTLVLCSIGVWGQTKPKHIIDSLISLTETAKGTSESSTGFINSGFETYNTGKFEIVSTDSLGNYTCYASRDASGKWTFNHLEKIPEVVYQSMQYINKYYKQQSELHVAALMIIEAYRHNNTKALIKAYNHYNYLSKQK